MKASPLKRRRAPRSPAEAHHEEHVTRLAQVASAIETIAELEADRMKGVNPMKRYAFQDAPRCTATSKRTKQPCQAPAAKGWKVCRFHGSGGGAPTGEANGAFRHGFYSKEFRLQRLAARKAMRLAMGRLRAIVAKAKDGQP